MQSARDKNVFSPETRRGYYEAIILISLWIIVQCFLLWKNGIVTSLEAVKYIDQAKKFLATGRYTSVNFLFYSVQILLIAACLEFKINFLLLVIVQMIFNGISVACFYRLARRLSGSSL